MKTQLLMVVAYWSVITVLGESPAVGAIRQVRAPQLSSTPTHNPLLERGQPSAQRSRSSATVFNVQRPVASPVREAAVINSQVNVDSSRPEFMPQLNRLPRNPQIVYTQVDQIRNGKLGSVPYHKPVTMGEPFAVSGHLTQPEAITDEERELHNLNDPSVIEIREILPPFMVKYNEDGTPYVPNTSHQSRLKTTRQELPHSAVLQQSFQTTIPTRTGNPGKPLNSLRRKRPLHRKPPSIRFDKHRTSHEHIGDRFLPRVGRLQEFTSVVKDQNTPHSIGVLPYQNNQRFVAQNRKQSDQTRLEIGEDDQVYLLRVPEDVLARKQNTEEPYAMVLTAPSEASQEKAQISEKSEKTKTKSWWQYLPLFKNFAESESSIGKSDFFVSGSEVKNSFLPPPNHNKPFDPYLSEAVDGSYYYSTPSHAKQAAFESLPDFLKPIINPIKRLVVPDELRNPFRGGYAPYRPGYQYEYNVPYYPAPYHPPFRSARKSSTKTAIKSRTNTRKEDIMKRDSVEPKSDKVEKQLIEMQERSHISPLNEDEQESELNSTGIYVIDTGSHYAIIEGDINDYLKFQKRPTNKRLDNARWRYNNKRRSTVPHNDENTKFLVSSQPKLNASSSNETEKNRKQKVSLKANVSKTKPLAEYLANKAAGGAKSRQKRQLRNPFNRRMKIQTLPISRSDVQANYPNNILLVSNREEQSSWQSLRKPSRRLAHQRQRPLKLNRQPPFAGASNSHATYVRPHPDLVVPNVQLRAPISAAAPKATVVHRKPDYKLTQVNPRDTGSTLNSSSNAPKEFQFEPSNIPTNTGIVDTEYIVKKNTLTQHSPEIVRPSPPDQNAAPSTETTEVTQIKRVRKNHRQRRPNNGVRKQRFRRPIRLNFATNIKPQSTQSTQQAVFIGGATHRPVIFGSKITTSNDLVPLTRTTSVSSNADPQHNEASSSQKINTLSNSNRKPELTPKVTILKQNHWIGSNDVYDHFNILEPFNNAKHESLEDIVVHDKEILFPKQFVDTGSTLKVTQTAISPVVTNQIPLLYPIYDSKRPLNYEATRQPTLKVTQQPTYETTRQPTNKVTQPPTYETTRQPTYEVRQPPTYETTRQPTYEVTQPPTYETTRQPIYEVRQPPTYETTRKPTYEVKQTTYETTRLMPTYEVAQPPTFETTKKTTYKTNQPPVYGTVGKPVYKTGETSTASYLEFEENQKQTSRAAELPPYETNEIPTYNTTGQPAYATKSVPWYKTTERPTFKTTKQLSYKTTEQPTHDVTQHHFLETTQQPSRAPIIKTSYLRSRKRLPTLSKTLSASKNLAYTGRKASITRYKIPTLPPITTARDQTPHVQLKNYLSRYAEKYGLNGLNDTQTSESEQDYSSPPVAGLRWNQLREQNNDQQDPTPASQTPASRLYDRQEWTQLLFDDTRAPSASQFSFRFQPPPSTFVRPKASVPRLAALLNRSRKPPVIKTAVVTALETTTTTPTPITTPTTTTEDYLVYGTTNQPIWKPTKSNALRDLMSKRLKSPSNDYSSIRSSSRNDLNSIVNFEKQLTKIEDDYDQEQFDFNRVPAITQVFDHIVLLPEHNDRERPSVDIDKFFPIDSNGDFNDQDTNEPEGQSSLFSVIYSDEQPSKADETEIFTKLNRFLVDNGEKPLSPIKASLVPAEAQEPYFPQQNETISKDGTLIIQAKPPVISANVWTPTSIEHHTTNNDLNAITTTSSTSNEDQSREDTEKPDMNDLFHEVVYYESTNGGNSANTKITDSTTERTEKYPSLTYDISTTTPVVSVKDDDDKETSEVEDNYNDNVEVEGYYIEPGENDSKSQQDPVRESRSSGGTLPYCLFGSCSLIYEPGRNVRVQH